MANTYYKETHLWVCDEVGELTGEGVTVVWIYYDPGAIGHSVTITDCNDEIAFYLKSQGSFKRSEQTPYLDQGRGFKGLKISQISGGTVYIYLRKLPGDLP